MIWIEAFKMAMGAIRAHKLRSCLTLVGIIAGVSSIIAVMTGISVIQSTMEQEMSVLGSTTFQVQKWPAGGFNNNADFRKIQQRKPITIANANAVRDRVKTVDLVGAELWRFGSTAKFKDKSTNSNLWLCGGTKEYPPNNTHYVEFGKNITDEDVRVGRKVVVIGYQVAETLFPFIDPIGQVIKTDGRKYTVIGVFEEKKSAMGGNFDNYLLLPVTTFQRAYGMRDERRGSERSVNMTVNVARVWQPGASFDVRLLRTEFHYVANIALSCARLPDGLRGAYRRGGRRSGRGRLFRQLRNADGSSAGSQPGPQHVGCRQFGRGAVAPVRCRRRQPQADRLGAGGLGSGLGEGPRQSGSLGRQPYLGQHLDR